MTQEEIAALLAAKFEGRVLESKLDAVNPWSVLDPSSILAICRFLREDERLSMDHL